MQKVKKNGGISAVEVEAKPGASQAWSLRQLFTSGNEPKASQLLHLLAEQVTF